MARRTSPKEPYTKLSVRWPETAQKALKEIEQRFQKNEFMHWSQGEIVAYFFMRGLEAERQEKGGTYPSTRRRLLGVSA
jgi:hypothetical protein